MIQELMSTADRINAAKAALLKREALAAIVHLRQALTEQPQNSEAAELLGVAHSQAGNREAALESFRLATELERGRATAHYNYAFLLFQDKDSLDEAIEENQAALMIKPDYAQALALQETLRQRIRERAWRSEEDFAVVQTGDVDPRHQASGTFVQLQCTICGGMNFSTARTCVRCGSLIPEMDEIVPVE